MLPRAQIMRADHARKSCAEITRGDHARRSRLDAVPQTLLPPPSTCLAAWQSPCSGAMPPSGSLATPHLPPSLDGLV